MKSGPPQVWYAKRMQTNRLLVDKNRGPGRESGRGLSWGRCRGLVEPENRAGIDQVRVVPDLIPVQIPEVVNLRRYGSSIAVSGKHRRGDVPEAVAGPHDIVVGAG